MNYKYCKHHDIDTIENPEFFSRVKSGNSTWIKCFPCHREAQKKYLSKPGMDQIVKERRKIKRENPEQKLKAKIRKIRFRKKRKLHIRKYNRTYEKNRRDNDPMFRCLKNLRTRLWTVLRKNIKSDSTMKLTGCTLEQLKKHLESKFEDGMSWDNYGTWHVDHIIGCANFDFSDPKQQQICFHYTNLQPMWGEHNMQKGSRLI